MKKGFTLIELLAVIVILAIILAIAIPSITNVINNSTKKAFESDAKMVLNTVKLKLLENEAFDVTSVNETNLQTLLGINDDNYEKVVLNKANDNLYILLVGKNKFDNLVVTGNKLSIQSYESPVTSGLLLWLDGNDFFNSPATTSWFDRSGNNKHATPYNLSYTASSGSDNAGNVVFDGSNDYVDFSVSGLTTTASVEMWCKLGTGYSGAMMFGWSVYDVYANGGIGYNTASSDTYGIPTTTVNTLGIVNNWAHYVFEMRSDVSYTNNKIYINGTQQTLSQILGTESAGARTFNSGNGRIASWRSGGYNMPMSCAAFKVYNRALTSIEIQQNYNLFKARFDL